MIARGKAFIADKTPGNYHALGLLPLLFPQCRIVHVDRDPMDTCFSILQQPFDNKSPHTFDIDLLAYSYGHYQQMLRTWRELLGARFLTVQYEALVASPAQEGQRMYSHCGLEWDDRYLEFNTNPAAVHTFSAVEVRQPISTARVGAWQRYADALEPLRAALEREGVALD
ncbi:MAG: sulfotransferase [Gammaproteobacteria bacterium]|nr:sulfotransferase [Gammaproteobacteria bacterium]